MPSYLNVYNTTLEEFKTQFRSKGFRFHPRAITKLPEEFEFALPQYAKHGLVIIKPGDDLKAKEREGLMNYLGFLMEQRAYLNMYLDEKRRNGVTVDKPRALKKIEQWIEEIKEKYSADEEFDPVMSFKDQLPLDGAALFKGDMEFKVVEEIVKKSPKKVSSFKDVKIEDEIRN